MRREYAWGPLVVVVEAPDDAEVYRVILKAEEFGTTPMGIDAHWGADHAAKIALDIYVRAYLDPTKFLAEERTEARHMSASYRDVHVQWARAVLKEASVSGHNIRKAAQAASEQEQPVDLSDDVNAYLGLTQTGHEMAVAGLITEGHSVVEAQEIHAERTLQDYVGKWRFAPSRRLPTAARG